MNIDQTNQPVSELTRQQLYELVWATPLSKLATRYGLSDVGLAKLCRRHNVPIPYRGYWARVSSGQTPSRIPMPKGDDVSISLVPVQTEAESPRDEEIEVAIAKSTRFSSEDVVSASLDELHPAVRRVKSLLSKAKADEYGRLAVDPKKNPAAWVAPASLARALCVLDAIAKGAVRRGHKLIDESASLCLEVDRQRIGFHIEEPSQRHDVSAEEIAQLRKKSPYAYIRDYRYEPTGVLILKVDPWISSNHQVRRQWRDTKHQRIETGISEFFASVAAMAIYMRRDAEERAIQKARWDHEQKLRNEAESAARQLKDLAERHDHVEKLRRVLAEMERRGIDMSPAVAGFPDWRSWAEAYIAQQDPLSTLELGKQSCRGWPQ